MARSVSSSLPFGPGIFLKVLSLKWSSPGSLIISTVLAVLCTGCVATLPSDDAASANPRHTTGSFESASGCTNHYTVYQPIVSRGGITVVLGHGFLRNQMTMSGLASSIADQGVPVVTLSYCNMSIFNGHHQRNADDMIALAGHLHLQQPVYAGFSAGALAAVIAATKDPSTMAVFTLDLVDANGLTENSLDELDIPVYAFVGQPSSCNRQSSATGLLKQYDVATVAVIDNASHCEFESPTDRFCEWFCGDNQTTAENNATRRLIVETVTALVSDLINKPE